MVHWKSIKALILITLIKHFTIQKITHLWNKESFNFITNPPEPEGLVKRLRGKEERELMGPCRDKRERPGIIEREWGDWDKIIQEASPRPMLGPTGVQHECKHFATAELPQTPSGLNLLLWFEKNSPTLFL
jgi:hypothetical protein